MKKKIISLALVVALIAIVVGGTLAYFTDEDAVTNTFTIGSVKIEIYENNAPTPSDKLDFTKPLTPVVNVTNPSADESYQEKVVKVKNTGANAAYIRVHIAIPAALKDYLCLDWNTTGWTTAKESTASVGDVDYIVYTYDHDASVSAGQFTGELLKGVYLASDVDLEEDTNGNLLFVKKTNGEVTHKSGFMAHKKTTDGYESTVVNVLVASEAIQAQGFDGKTATEALNTGFPKANPWTNN